MLVVGEEIADVRRAPATLALLAAMFAGVAGNAVAASDLPRSEVTTGGRGDLRVTEFTMSLRRDGRKLSPFLRIELINRSDHIVRRVVRVGPCRRGPIAFPTCANQVTIRVQVPARERYRRFARLPEIQRPPGAYDNVQAALVRAAAHQPYRAAAPDAFLTLNGSAWRGSAAGRRYGAVVPGVADGAVRRVRVDVPAKGAENAYINVRWEGPSAPARAQTTIGRCLADACDPPAPLRFTGSRSGQEMYGKRTFFAKQHADRVAVAATLPGRAQPLFRVSLPWPVS